VTNITEHENSGDVACSTLAGQSLTGTLGATIKVTTTTSQNITDNLRTQRVTSKHKLRVRAR